MEWLGGGGPCRPEWREERWLASEGIWEHQGRLAEDPESERERRRRDREIQRKLGQGLLAVSSVRDSSRSSSRERYFLLAIYI
jgi:hypothetical protein